MPPSISVIVPVFNCRRFLSECVDSILAQNPPPAEIILVNDGSTDGSDEICRLYAEGYDNIRTFNIAEDAPGAARNVGLEEARGEFVTFVDGDDMLFPGALSLMASLMADNVDIAGGRWIRAKRFPHLGNSLGRRYTCEILSGREAKLSMLYQSRFTATICGRLYRKKLFNGIRFNSHLYYEDLELNSRLLERVNSVAITSAPVYFYRLNPLSITSVWSKRRLDVMKVTDMIESQALESGDVDMIRAAGHRRMSAAFNMFILSEINEMPAQARKCWREIVRLRRYGLTDSRVRLKNKLGAALSYLGPDVVSRIGKLLYR